MVRGSLLRLRTGALRFCFFTLSSLELSVTTVYAPSIRALLRTASQFCEEVVRFAFAVERTWRIEDSHSHGLALALR